MTLDDNGRAGYDTTRGVIIGGDFVGWQLFYDGRPQGGKEYADSDSKAIEAAKLRRDRLVAELAGWPCFLYQDPSKWEVRLT